MKKHPYRPLEEGLMAIPFPDARELSPAILEALRLRALRACELGFHETDIADFLGVRRETVSRWWSAYAQGGFEARPQGRPGWPLVSRRVPTRGQADRVQ